MRRKFCCSHGHIDQNWYVYTVITSGVITSSVDRNIGLLWILTDYWLSLVDYIYHGLIVPEDIKCHFIPLVQSLGVLPPLITKLNTAVCHWQWPFDLPDITWWDWWPVLWVHYEWDNLWGQPKHDCYHSDFMVYTCFKPPPSHVIETGC